jgi:hypothetical protein
MVLQEQAVSRIDPSWEPHEPEYVKLPGRTILGYRECMPGKVDVVLEGNWKKWEEGKEELFVGGVYGPLPAEVVVDDE